MIPLGMPYAVSTSLTSFTSGGKSQGTDCLHLQKDEEINGEKVCPFYRKSERNGTECFAWRHKQNPIAGHSLRVEVFFVLFEESLTVLDLIESVQ